MKLDQFLKWHSLASSGGEAKHLITSGMIFVNGAVETRRGRKLRQGDKVRLGKEEFIVCKSVPLGP